MTDENDLTYLQKSRIRIEALIPVIRAIEKEIGVERAHLIVRKALADEVREQIPASRRGRIPGRMPITSAGLDASFASDGALEYEVLREDDEAFEFNVTGCRYKALMIELGALDLGKLFFCDNDFPSAEAMGLDLVRTQTCMQGASHCDFRYRIRKD